jgi:hypothetical protein
MLNLCMNYMVLCLSQRYCPIHDFFASHLYCLVVIRSSSDGRVRCCRAPMDKQCCPGEGHVEPWSTLTWWPPLPLPSSPDACTLMVYPPVPWQMARNDGGGFGAKTQTCRGWRSSNFQEAKDASRIYIFTPQNNAILFLSLISLFEHKLDNNFGTEGVHVSSTMWKIRSNHLTPLLVVTMPFTCWFLWHVDYIEGFKRRLPFQFGVAFWRGVLREVCFEGPDHVWRALKTSILNTDSTPPTHPPAKLGTRSPSCTIMSSNLDQPHDT